MFDLARLALSVGGVRQGTKEKMMKKSVLAVVATLVAVCQFGCSGSLAMAHDVLAHVLAIGWTADMFNLIP